MKTKDLTSQLDLDKTPSGQEEELAYSEPQIYDPKMWQNPDVRRKLLANQDFENDIKEKQRFARFAYCVSGVWVVFLMIIVWCQAIPDWFGFELPEGTFGLVVGSLTLSVFGFAFLVGKYLFPEGGAKRD